MDQKQNSVQNDFKRQEYLRKDLEQQTVSEDGKFGTLKRNDYIHNFASIIYYSERGAKL